MQHEKQRRLIVEQFTRQAVPFAQMPLHNGAETNRLVLDSAGIGPDDTVLDVACGPGLITCAAAQRARHVSGIDITPAMIQQARGQQNAQGLKNLDWHIGPVESLPFERDRFSVVMTRYSFHHLLEPRLALAEMARVCQPGGRVAVVDVFMRSAEQGRLYDEVEKLRDASHTRALPLDELMGMFVDAGLLRITPTYYKLEVELEPLLTATCTPAADADKVRAIFADDLAHDRLGVGAQKRDGSIWFSFPIVILVGHKP